MEAGQRYFNNNTFYVRSELACVAYTTIRTTLKLESNFADNVAAAGTAFERFGAYNGMLHCDMSLEKYENALVNARQALDAALSIRQEASRAYHSATLKLNSAGSTTR